MFPHLILINIGWFGPKRETSKPNIFVIMPLSFYFTELLLLSWISNETKNYLEQWKMLGDFYNVLKVKIDIHYHNLFLFSGSLIWYEIMFRHYWLQVFQCIYLEKKYFESFATSLPSQMYLWKRRPRLSILYISSK